MPIVRSRIVVAGVCRTWRRSPTNFASGIKDSTRSSKGRETTFKVSLQSPIAIRARDDEHLAPGPKHFPGPLTLSRPQPLACGLGLDSDELPVDAADVIQRALTQCCYDRHPNVQGSMLHGKRKQRTNAS